MSIWQWQAAINGYVEANSSRDGAKLTESEADELFDWIGAGNDTGLVLSTQTYAFDAEGHLAPAGIVTFTTR